ncbi:MAG: CBS domain-containing protein [Archaeoglobaceae archaeon]
MFPEIEEIRRRRKRLGISQKKLAELVGVSQPLIAKLESGKIDPKLSLLKKILDVLDELEGRVKAANFMNSPVISVEPETSIKDAVRLMIEHGISQIPVSEGGKVVGLVTENRIVRAIFEEKGVRKVSEVMEPPPPIVDERTPISSIVKLLLEFPAVLVAKDGEIVGIITKHDVMRAMLGR